MSITHEQHAELRGLLEAGHPAIAKLVAINLLDAFGVAEKAVHFIAALGCLHCPVQIPCRGRELEVCARYIKSRLEHRDPVQEALETKLYFLQCEKDLSERLRKDRAAAEARAEQAERERDALLALVTRENSCQMREGMPECRYDDENAHPLPLASKRKVCIPCWLEWARQEAQRE